MTWDEFVEKYGDGDCDIVSFKASRCRRFIFWYDGDITVIHNSGGIETRLLIAENRTPAQMEQILISLTEEQTNE